jgi:predicted permease
MRSLIRDARHAMRTLLGQPGFTVAAVVTLALGIGANTAIFSLAGATLLRPLDVADPVRLVSFTWSSSYPDYKEFAARRDVFTGVLASGGTTRVSLRMDGAAELVRAGFLSGNAFDVLGITPALGRTLQPSDDEPGGEVAGVLGYEFWRTRFASRPDAVGRTIQLNGRPVTIVGVARRGFRGTSLFSSPQLYLPLTSIARISTGFFERAPVLTSSGFVWLNVIGRLQTDVTLEQASSAVDTLYRQLHPPPPGRTPERLQLTPLNTRVLGESADALRRFVLLLAAVVGLTLLIGCANLANLLLARAAGRSREVAVRLALGAGRGRVVRLVLVESLLLAVAGGAAGVYVASLTLRLLAAYELPGGLDISGLDLGINPAALAATALLSIAAGLLFGTAPAWRASRANVMDALRGETRGATSPGRLRGALVAVQVAVSLLLLAGSGLFLRSLARALDVDLGFRPDGVIIGSVNPGLARYDNARARAFYEEAIARVRRLPQVESAGWASMIPTSGAMMFDPSELEDHRPAAGDDVTFHASQVGPGYFETVGTRIVEGRAFGEDDRAGAPKVVVVNETASRRFWGGKTVGRRMKVSDDYGWATIVGVAEDTTVSSIGERPVPFVYFPFDQGSGAIFGVETAHLFVRTSGRPDTAIALVSEQLRALDANVPLYYVREFSDTVRGLVMPQRLGATLLGAFSVLALALAAVGIYGVASYLAAQRRREIGIRMALGATRMQIGRLMLRQGTGPIAAGVIAGIVLALWAGGLAASFLHDVSPRDPVALAAATTLLATVALLATYLPARHAASVDPVVALRHE